MLYDNCLTNGCIHGLYRDYYGPTKGLGKTRARTKSWKSWKTVRKVGKLEIFCIHTSKIFPTFFITPTIPVNIPYKPERYQLLKKLEIWMVVGIQIPIPTEIIFLTYRTRYTLTSTFGKPPFI